MWKTVGWRLHSTHNFFGHLNPRLGGLTEVPDLLCLCRFPFASKWDNVGLELSFPECKHSMGCLLLGYHYFFLSTILQSTLLVPLALPFVTLLTLQHKPGMYRNATSNADWLHHRLCMTSPSAPSVTPDSLYGLPAETGADRLWLLWCAPSWLEASLILYKDVKPLV